MTNQERKQAEKAIRQEMERLYSCSIHYHGADYVRFSPCWKDYMSKRRIRLNRAFWALKGGRVA